VSAALSLVQRVVTGFAYVSNRDRNTWAARAKDGAQWSAWKAGQWVHSAGDVRPESQVGK
jgi:hypothetical protein